MHRTYERGTKARLDFSRGPHAPINMVEPVWKKWMSVGKNAGIPFWKRLLCCTALHFMRQIFANPWSSSGLPTPLWIQNYQISAMFTRGVARQRSSASLWCRARTFCAWLWNSLIVIAASVSECESEWMSVCVCVCVRVSEWVSEERASVSEWEWGVTDCRHQSMTPIYATHPRVKNWSKLWPPGL